MGKDMENLALPTDKNIEEYKHFRQIGRVINDDFISKLPKKAIEECGKKLGILKGKNLFLDESDTAVFFDYCLYHFRINKTNIIERELAVTSLDPKSIEVRVLESMAMAHYSVFFIKEVFEGKGILVVDFLYQTELFVIDIGLARAEMKNLVFSGHLLPLKNSEFYMTSGLLPTPFDLLQNDSIASIISKFIDEDSDDFLSKAKETSFAAQIIRTVLRYDGEKSEVRYNEV